MKRAVLLVEFLLLFLGLPLAFALDRIPLPLFPALWLLTAGCLVWLIRAPGFDARNIWNVAPLRAWLRPVLWTVGVGVVVLAAATWWLAPERLLGFVRERPGTWALVMVLYPILSAFPQGIVYRTFLLRRYRPLLSSRASRIAASAIAFSLAHVIFENWIAPVFSLVGGALFAWTHERSGSPLVATVQHALFGCAVFTLGLGWYFYAGAVR